VKGGEGRAGRYVYILSYTFVYIYIPLNTSENLYILLCTPVHIIIPNIRKMRSDIRPHNGQKSAPKASPSAIICQAPSYHTPDGVFSPKLSQF